MSAEEIAEIRAQFDEVRTRRRESLRGDNLVAQFDADKNGHITCSEISEVMKALGESIPGYQIRDMVREVDLDENGTIEFNEFIEVRRRFPRVHVLPPRSRRLSRRERDLIEAHRLEERRRMRA